MLDFETFGNGPNKCLCQVAAVYFDPLTGQAGESFYRNINAISHQKIGGTIDAQTVYWWMAQDDAARKSLLLNLNDESTNIVTVMKELNEFIKGAYIWSHATFDFVTLKETLQQCGITPSFTYKSGLDIRTLVYLSKVKVSNTARQGVHHNALDDCMHQIKYCFMAFKQLQLTKQILQKILPMVEE